MVAAPCGFGLRPMAYRKTTRKDDERDLKILSMMFDEGLSSYAIGRAFGLTGAAVRTMVNRIKADDREQEGKECDYGTICETTVSGNQEKEVD